MASNSTRVIMKAEKSQDAQSTFSSESESSLVAYTDIHTRTLDGSSVNRAISASNTTDLRTDTRTMQRTLDRGQLVSSALNGGDADLQSMIQYVDSFTSSLKQTLQDQFASSQQRQSRHWESHLNDVLRQYEETDKEQKNEICQLRDQVEDIQSLLTQTRESNIQLTERNKNLEHRVKSQVHLSQALSKWRRDCERLEFINKYMDQVIVPQRKKLQLRRAFYAWQDIYRSGYKKRVDKLWNNRLEQLSRKLIEDYESTLSNMRSQMTELSNTVARLNSERQHIETNMKRAFMRGVSALNLEALSLFNDTADPNERHDDVAEENGDFQPRAEVPLEHE